MIFGLFFYYFRKGMLNATATCSSAITKTTVGMAILFVKQEDHDGPISLT